MADGVPSEVTQSTTREAMSALLHGEVTYISKESLAQHTIESLVLPFKFFRPPSLVTL